MVQLRAYNPPVTYTHTNANKHGCSIQFVSIEKTRDNDSDGDNNKYNMLKKLERKSFENTHIHTVDPIHERMEAQLNETKDMWIHKIHSYRREKNIHITEPTQTYLDS